MEIRATSLADAAAILEVHRAAAANGGGLAREPDEMDLAGIEASLAKPLANGVALVARIAGRAAGEIHASRLGPRQFAHNLTDLTVAVHPDFQGRGVGAALFAALFAEAAKLTPRIERVELMCRDGNLAAVRLYQRLGFVIEGRFPGRVRLKDGTVEDDLAMARLL
ncbi:GNAT family N-acetyltransferase [Phenylobacterium sp.]|jgi:putative acetyltransferase|uniref:GNAT family N-acetyltransferase n=1 Tax=Phenylobacterium sp. TaxID=1871053 RepID=UPI002E30C89B|nr:GNAT family N-acetyltransferase [Phenylobacterium sp.]HEX4709023.1 GNAT family N-acetyltransferase [Phenylobacterium sp.]